MAEPTNDAAARNAVKSRLLQRVKDLKVQAAELEKDLYTSVQNGRALSVARDVEKLTKVLEKIQSALMSLII